MRMRWRICCRRRRSNPSRRWSAATTDKLDAAAALLRGFDILFTQDFGAEFGPLATAALPALGPPVHRLPLVAFAGYHPDMVYLTAGGQVQGSPLGAYHSAIIAAAFSLGVAEADVPQLFNRLVYGRLGYLQGFDAARTLLLECLAAHGLDMTEDFAAWHAAGPFMHGINHPRGRCWPMSCAPRRSAPGCWARRRRGSGRPSTTWPPTPSGRSIPEIAEALGMPGGGMLFKRYSHPVGRSATRSISACRGCCGRATRCTAPCRPRPSTRARSAASGRSWRRSSA